MYLGYLIRNLNADFVKTWIECNERNILEYGKAEGPTPEQLYKKYGSWENVIYGSLKQIQQWMS